VPIANGYESLGSEEHDISIAKSWRKLKKQRGFCCLYTECDFLREVLSPFGEGCRHIYLGGEE
jgi:hypothetical protein